VVRLREHVEVGEGPLRVSEVDKPLLAAPGMDVNRADNDGDTPLQVWHDDDDDEIRALLLAAGATN